MVTHLIGNNCMLCSIKNLLKDTVICCLKVCCCRIIVRRIGCHCCKKLSSLRTRVIANGVNLCTETCMVAVIKTYIGHTFNILPFGSFDCLCKPVFTVGIEICRCRICCGICKICCKFGISFITRNPCLGKSSAFGASKFQTVELCGSTVRHKYNNLIIICIGISLCILKYSVCIVKT